MMLKLFKRDESFSATLENVLYFKAEGHYTHVYYCKDSKILLPYGLSQVEKELQRLHDGHYFVKVGRSHIIDMRKVVYASITKECFTLIDRNGMFTNIIVSRSAIKQLMKIMRGDDNTNGNSEKDCVDNDDDNGTNDAKNGRGGIFSISL